MTFTLNGNKYYTEKPNLNLFNMHTHDNYEIYCFLSGSAKYFVEGNVYHLKPGDIFIIKKAEAHSLLINADTPYERMVVNFSANSLLADDLQETISFLDNKPLGKNNLYSATKFKTKQWIYYLEKICSTENISKKRLYLTVLVLELKEKYIDICDNNTHTDSFIEITEYINQHISEELSLDKICNHFYISKSHLNRKFKQLIGSTAWEYITKKRLILAKELLQNGEQPTTVYLTCGFNDYCTFFRAYKNHFGVSPKKDIIKN